LRVGIRRLRTVLRIFKAKQLERRLRKITKPLGEARDWDVFVARFGRGEQERRAAHLRSREVLAGAELRAFFAEAHHWAHLNARAGEAPLRAFAGKALERMHRKALQRSRDIDWRDAKRRHAARIAVRRLRYACDFFSPCFSGSQRYLRGLADLQDLLGELNDIAVARRFGRSGTALDRSERALLNRLEPAWRAFEKRPRFWARFSVGKGKPRSRAS